MQPLHELIDRDDPSCLYCKSPCDLMQDGFLALTSLYYECQILTCRKCKEIFEIHWVEDNGETRYVAFVFTCKDIVVDYQYADGIHIGGRELLYHNKFGTKPITGGFLPAFPIDFSNKRKLHNKLKTYLVFS